MKTLFIIISVLVVIAVLVVTFFGVRRYKEIKSSMSTPLSFPTSPLTQEELDRDYQTINHKLSPLSDYHFQMIIRNDWTTLDLFLKKEIEPNDDKFYTIGGFKPKDRLDDENLIEVMAGRMENSKPIIPLKEWVKAQYGSDLLLLGDYRKVGESGEDLLYTVKSEGRIMVNRAMLFRDTEGNVFMIRGQADKDRYNEYADAFYGAMASFKLLKWK